MVVPGAKVEPEDGLHATGSEPSTASTAVGIAQLAGVPDGLTASIARSSGIPSRFGGVVSTTFTTNVAVAALPAVSAEEHVTLVPPRGKMVPAAGAHGAGRLPLTASVATGEGQLTRAPSGPVASTATSPRPVIAGGVASPTVTLKLPLTTLPC